MNFKSGFIAMILIILVLLVIAYYTELVVLWAMSIYLTFMLPACSTEN